MAGAGCAQPPPQTEELEVSQAEYGRSWPFTVDDGVLRCGRRDGVEVLMFASGGKTYALNAAARWEGHSSTNEIRDTDPHTGKPESLQPLVDAAIDLCKAR